MIETAKQTREAIGEILALTGWTRASLCDRIPITRPTIYRILSGATKNPTPVSMAIIQKELTRVRKVHG